MPCWAAAESRNTSKTTNSDRGDNDDVIRLRDRRDNDENEGDVDVDEGSLLRGGDTNSSWTTAIAAGRELSECGGKGRS